jgi:hypothetical protein
MTELEEFRKQKDVFLATDRHSPLTAGQRKDFKGLEYFPENPDLRLEVDVEELPEKHTVEMQTSTGSVQSYIRYGTFKFSVDGSRPSSRCSPTGTASSCPSRMHWPERRPTARAATWSRSSSRTAGCWSISITPITRTAPTMSSSHARSHQLRTA